MNYKIQKQYEKNVELENLLDLLNPELAIADYTLTKSFGYPKQRPIFIIGCPRSGTSLIHQWLASLGVFSYPSNLISRFYCAPYIGCLIQKILFDKKLDHHYQLGEYVEPFSFLSDLGHTKGMFAPNEFNYWWWHLLNDEEKTLKAYSKGIPFCFNDFIRGVSSFENAFNKPVVMKAIPIMFNLDILWTALPNGITILNVNRDSFYCAQSILEAREKYYGDISCWWSCKPHEFDKKYPSDLLLNPFLEVAAQVQMTKNQIDKQKINCSSNVIWIDLYYEDFCSNQFTLIEQLEEYYPEIDKITLCSQQKHFPLKNSIRLNPNQVEELNTFLRECKDVI